MAEDSFSLPSDVLVLIVLLLPTSARRRLRLVCKLWRDVIDERTSEMQSRSKTLAFLTQDLLAHRVHGPGDGAGPRARARRGHQLAAAGHVAGLDSGRTGVATDERSRESGYRGDGSHNRGEGDLGAGG
ncbi:hypothetical protein PR202_gb02810 [Eleusine coracana subsp. coracana]|uniref:F-box domain-containing protein n=1 Tax=Eleusine coracana subsp. coracana TaxID=191504 RepID=A0AAV5E175_ELECO|nr:hypothetical protein PR202_gb02810 [Eleusine coracana subsp. coracana]